jgi:hypothetical protein
MIDYTLIIFSILGSVIAISYKGNFLLTRVAERIGGRNSKLAIISTFILAAILLGVMGYVIVLPTTAASALVAGIAPSALIGGVLSSRREEERRITELNEARVKAERALTEEPEKIRPIWDLSRNQLEIYINRNISQVRNIFWIVIVVMTAGFSLIVYGIYRSFDSHIQISVLSVAAGIITQIIGSTFLLIYRSIMQQATDYVSALEKINAVGMALAIVDLIPEDDRGAKTRAQVELATRILGAVSHAPSRNPSRERSATKRR